MATVNGVPFRQNLVSSSKYSIKAPNVMKAKKSLYTIRTMMLQHKMRRITVRTTIMKLVSMSQQMIKKLFKSFLLIEMRGTVAMVEMDMETGIPSVQKSVTANLEAPDIQSQSKMQSSILQGYAYSKELSHQQARLKSIKTGAGNIARIAFQPNTDGQRYNKRL